MAEQEHWRMQLNNYLQTTYGLAVLTWWTGCTGPNHAPTWEAVAYISGVEYGRGIGHTQGAAKEVAAQQALSVLWARRGG